MVPESAVFVVSDNHHHMHPLRTLLQVSNELADVLVAIEYVCVPGMLVEIALRFVERDLRQSSVVDRLEKFSATKPAILQMFGARLSTGSHNGKIIERLMMVLEIRHGNRVLALERN